MHTALVVDWYTPRGSVENALMSAPWLLACEGRVSGARLLLLSKFQPLTKPLAFAVAQWLREGGGLLLSIRKKATPPPLL
jgi:hypothetical protein